MDIKHRYITVEEKKEFEALIKQYGLEEQTARFRQKPKLEQPRSTRKSGIRRARQ